MAVDVLRGDDTGTAIRRPGAVALLDETNNFPGVHLDQEAIIGRRGRVRRPERQPEQHRVNHRIRFPQIRVIGADGEQLGVMTPDEGREHAKEAGFDLVEVAPNARPPVCKIMDYGKYRYEQSKKKAASKASKTSSMTLRMRPNIEQHDLNTKMRKALKTLEKGGQVRLVMRMRGRERAVPGRWVSRLNEIISDMKESIDRDVEVTQRPKAEGRQITATIDPR